MTEEHKGNVQAALDEFRDSYASVHEDFTNSDGDLTPYVIAPKGVELKSLKPIIDSYLAQPERMKGTALLSDLESLASYVNLYKRRATLVYLDDLDPKAPSVHVVFDAHTPNGADPELEAPAGWGDFGARYFFPLSPEWEAWREIAGQWLEQGQFAAFMEDRLLDIADPTDPGERAKAIAAELGLTLAGRAKLFELSRGLRVNVQQNVNQEVSLGSGEGQLFFQEKHADEKGDMLRVPGAFAIAVPVFRGSATAYRMIVMLRYRVHEKRVRWQLAPHLIETVFEDALEGAAAELRAKTSIPVLRGRPIAGNYKPAAKPAA